MKSVLFKKGILPIIFSVVILSVFGLATLYSGIGSNEVFYKQMIVVSLSMTVGICASFINFRFLRQSNSIFYFYLFAVCLLIAILVLGVTVNNAQSWFHIGAISIQPSEIAKLAVILILAKYLYKRHFEIADIRHVLMSFLYAVVVGLLVLKQPDLGSALVIFGIWGIMLLVSGVSKKHIFIIFTVATTIFYISWQFIFLPYQKDRILNFLDPLRDVRGSGYNVYQSIIAVGSGGVYGKGISQGTQSKLNYLPENDTDFIFASFAEEWGFIGVALCIIIFITLIGSLLVGAMQMETNFETLFTVGVSAYFLIHFVVNVGMNLGVLPVTGIPLPLMSAGGTHTILEWIMLGMVISMAKLGSKNSHKNKDFFAL